MDLACGKLYEPLVGLLSTRSSNSFRPFVWTREISGYDTVCVKRRWNPQHIALSRQLYINRTCH
jgi:hypothetical protein